MKNFNKEDSLIEIIFEDDYIVVINKKNGLLSHCNQIESNISVVSLLKKCDIKLYEAEDRLRDGIVHRLDRDTSGLMVLAKSLFSYKSLIDQFHDRKVIKIYKAYCWGIPMPIAGTIDKPISNYLNRKKIVKDCTTLSYKNIETLKWMPKTCSYRLINEGKKLPSWHYLLTGNFEEMEKQRMCIRNRVTNEKEIDIKKIQNHITDWENN